MIEFLPLSEFFLMIVLFYSSSVLYAAHDAVHSCFFDTHFAFSENNKQELFLFKYS